MKSVNLNKALFRRLIPAMLVPLCAMVVSCNDDSDTPSERATLYDVVEFTSQSASGTVFTLWRPDATETITLTTSTPVIDASNVAAGESVFLAYIPANGKPYTSGPVGAVTYGFVNNSVVKKSTAEKLEGWDAEPIYLMSLWRAGGKICMRLRMTYDTAPRLFALVVDESTTGDEYPTAYLYHRRPSDVPNFSRQYYAAFDVTPLWATPGCKGLRVRVANSNIPTLDTFVVENPWPVAAEHSTPTY